MSCEDRRGKLHHLVAQALAGLPSNQQPVLKLDGRPLALTPDNLERMFTAANNAANVKALPADALADLRQQVIEVMRLFDAAGLPRPTHVPETSDPAGRLPKKSLWPGYATLQALIHASPPARTAVLRALAPRTSAQVLALAAQTRTETGTVQPQACESLFAHAPRLSLAKTPAQAYRQYVAETLGLKVDELTIRENPGGDLQGASGEPVQFIYAGGKKVAVAKQMRLDTCARELSALAYLARPFQHFQTPRLLGFCALQSGAKVNGLLLTSLAPGQAYDFLLHHTGQLQSPAARERALGKLEEIVGLVGRAYAELHQTSTVPGRFIAPAYREHYIASTLDILEHIERHPYWRALGLIDARLLRRAVEAGALAFQQCSELASVAHGDAHAGNVFYDSAAGLTLIDVQTLHESLDQQAQALGAAARDSTAFDVRLWSFGLKFGLKETEINGVRAAFAQAYRAHQPDRRPRSTVFLALRAALGGLLSLLKESDTAPRLIELSAVNYSDLIEQQAQLLQAILEGGPDYVVS